MVVFMGLLLITNIIFVLYFIQNELRLIALRYYRRLPFWIKSLKQGLKKVKVLTIKWLLRKLDPTLDLDNKSLTSSSSSESSSEVEHP